MSSLSDIFTASKNIAVAINNMSQVYLSNQGKQRSQTINNSSSSSSETLVSTGAGRLASVSVIASPNKGTILDDDGTEARPSVLYTIPAGFLGVVVVNVPYQKGLLVTLGAGMTVVVSYSEG